MNNIFYRINRNRMFSLLFLLLIFFLVLNIIGTISAADYTVSGNDFGSIQSTVDGVSSGDVINLAGGTYNGSGSEISVSTNNLVFNGQGAILDANGNSRIFMISSDNVTLQNMILRNGNFDGYGAAVYVAGANFKIINCSVLNNVGDGGGGIMITSSSPGSIVDNCMFSSNVASYGAKNGGALAIHASNVCVSNSVFINNMADGHGGALTVNTVSGGTLSNINISNCNFTSNTATTMAGGIFLSSNITVFLITGCLLSDNTAPMGGGIYTTSPLSISSSTFKNNSANNGGGIYSTNRLTLSSTSGTNNKATSDNGGFIYGTGTININGGTFSSNIANSNGGAIFTSGSNSLTVAGVTFTNNTATNGGAIRTSGSSTIGNSNFNLNKATNTGGAVYTSSSSRLTGSTFKDNSAVNGGGIYSSSTLILTSTSGDNNNANNGGFIYGTGNINLTGGSFNNNIAKSNGGAVYGTGTINIKNNAKFNSNTAINGGAIFSTNNLNIVSSNFTNNKATTGGAVHVSKLTVDNGTFSSNVASSNGGAIYSKGSVTIKNKSVFNSNKATNGGALYSLASSTIDNSNFYSNVASSSGGAVYSKGSMAIKNKSIFNSNSGSNGGAIYSLNTLSIASSTLNSNSAKSNGGAIYSNKTSSFSYSTLKNNKASTGGAICSFAGSTIDKSNFYSNVASSSGGAVYSKGSVNIKNKSIFNGNNGKEGGAIYSSNTLSIFSSNITNNKAVNGGGIYSSATLTIDTGIFSNNKANSNGGGLYANGKTSIKGNSKFTSNSANKGAAIFSNQNSVAIAKSAGFKNNHAGIGLSLSLVNNVVKYGKTKVNVKTTGYGNNIKIGNDIPMWSNNYKKVKVNGKIPQKYTIKEGTKFKVSVNGKSVNIKFKSKTKSFVQIDTYPNYNWKNFTFTATYNGGKTIKKSTTTLKVSAKIANTDVYNVDMIKVYKKQYPTKKKLNDFISKNRKLYDNYKKYYSLYRKDKLETKINGKTYTKTIKQKASGNAYFLGAEKVPADLRKFLWAYKGTADVNESSIKQKTFEILASLSLKTKYSSFEGILTPEKKLRAIQNWVGDNCVYLEEVEGGLISPAGGAEVLQRINNKSIKNHTNCVGFSNLFVSLARTAGIPVSYIQIPGHMIVAGYSIKNGKWYGVIIEPQSSFGNVYPSKYDDYRRGPIYSRIINGNMVIYYAIESVFGGDRTLDGINRYNGLGIPLYDYQKLLTQFEYYYFDYVPNSIYAYLKCDIKYVY